HKRPVVLSLVYYECPMLCSMTLNGLVKSMRAMPFHIGDEFEVLTISFDPSEKPELAAAKKQVYVGDYGRPDAAAGWHFLTGSKASMAGLRAAACSRSTPGRLTKK